MNCEKKIKTKKEVLNNNKKKEKNLESTLLAPFPRKLYQEGMSLSPGQDLEENLSPALYYLYSMLYELREESFPVIKKEMGGDVWEGKAGP